MAAANPENVLVWMPTRSTYVESVPGTILRIKNASKFGENVFGFKDQPGDLVELEWKAVFKQRPTQVEINFGRNPCNSLVRVIEENSENVEMRQFFGKVKALSLHMTDISADDLLKLLNQFSLLAVFSFSETDFPAADWTKILKKLADLNLRGIEISSNILEGVRQNLDVSLMKLSGNPGVDVNEFKKGIQFVTVKALVVQELKFTGETDAEEFLEVLPQSFPNLKTLIWDWNVVDPELKFDDRTKGVIKQLAHVHQTLNEVALAVVAYTPSQETKSAMESFASELHRHIQCVQLHSLSTKGVAAGTSNFKLLLTNKNDETFNELLTMYLGDRSTMPPMGKLLRLCEGDIAPIYPAITMDFGGFDKTRIRQLYNE